MHFTARSFNSSVRSFGPPSPPETLFVKESVPAARSRSRLHLDTLFYDLAWTPAALFFSQKHRIDRSKKKKKKTRRKEPLETRSLPKLYSYKVVKDFFVQLGSRV